MGLLGSDIYSYLPYLQHIMGPYSQIPSGWAHGWSPTSLSAAASTSWPSSVLAGFLRSWDVSGQRGFVSDHGKIRLGPWESPMVYGRLWGLYLYIYIYGHTHRHIYIHNSVYIYTLYAYNIIYIYMCVCVTMVNGVYWCLYAKYGKLL